MMMTLHRTNSLLLVCLLSAVVTVGLSGCKTKSGEEGKTKSPADTGDKKQTHGHNHLSEGPHHGVLVELGDDEYHAEVVHDEKAGTVTIYILDSSAKKQVPIEAKEVTIHLKHNGQPETYKLAAQPDAREPAGKSSRYFLSDKDLAHALEHEDAGARLVLLIGGKSYSGLIKLDHAHHDHGHPH